MDVENTENNVIKQVGMGQHYLQGLRQAHVPNVKTCVMEPNK